MKALAPNQVSRFRSTRPFNLSPYVQTGVLFFFSLIFIFLHYHRSPTMGYIRTFVADYVHRTMALGSYPFLSLKNLQQEWHVLTKARQENIYLHQQIDDLKKWHYHARMLLLENKELRKALKALPQDTHVFLTTKVHKVLDPRSGSQMIIEAGTDQGLLKDQAVLVHGHLVGRLTDVSAQTSRILLLNDSLSRIPVVLEISGLRAIVAGTVNGSLTLNVQEENLPLHEGEMVISSGEGGAFPAGLPVGILEKNEDQTWCIRPLFNLDPMNTAQVLDPIALDVLPPHDPTS